MQIVGSVISMFLVDTAGRRALMVWGSALCGLTLLAVGVADGMHSAALLVTAMCAFILAFAASYAGVFWVLLSELFSMSAKAPATAAVTATLFLAGKGILFPLHPALHVLPLSPACPSSVMRML